MARKSPPPPKRRMVLSPQQMKIAIPKLERRIRQLQEFDFSTVRDWDNPEIDKLQNLIDSTLVEIFDNDSVEYDRYRVEDLYFSTGMSFDGSSSPADIKAKYQRGFGDATAKLESALEAMEEQLEDAGETPAGQALRAIEGLDLHPEIDRAAAKLYRDGYYANAVEDACKALNLLVKLRSGRDDLDGTSLMQEVFSAKNPTLAFNDLQTQSDHDEQQGLMFLFAGTILAFRNPRAHELILDDPERALETIGFISLLAKLLDQAKKP